MSVDFGSPLQAYESMVNPGLQRQFQLAVAPTAISQFMQQLQERQQLAHQQAFQDRQQTGLEDYRAQEAANAAERNAVNDRHWSQDMDLKKQDVVNKIDDDLNQRFDGSPQMKQALTLRYLAAGEKPDAIESRFKAKMATPMTDQNLEPDMGPHPEAIKLDDTAAPMRDPAQPTGRYELGSGLQVLRDAAEAKRIQEERAAREWGTSLHPGLGPDGRPGMFQTNKLGEVRSVPGMAPIPTKVAGNGMMQLPQDPEAAKVYADRLVKGLEPWPTQVSLRTDPVIREGMVLARQMDPAFNASTHKQRQTTYQHFTTGPEATTLNKINTALTHLSEYSDNLEQVPDVGVTGLNRLLNGMRGQFGNVDIASANTTMTTLANELEGAYRAGGGTEAGVSHMREMLDPNLPLAARRANLATVTKLLQGKESAMLDQYNRGMGKFAAPLDMLDAEAKKAQQKVLKRGGMAPDEAAPAGGSDPAPDPAPSGGKAPIGTKVLMADGTTKTKTANGWE